MTGKRVKRAEAKQSKVSAPFTRFTLNRGVTSLQLIGAEKSLVIAWTCKRKLLTATVL